MRYLVSADLVFNTDGTLAQSVPFTLWSEKASGFEYTDVVAPDGLTPIELVTTPEGQSPEYRFPDEIKDAWMDTGATFRTYIHSAEAIHAKLIEPANADLLVLLAAQTALATQAAAAALAAQVAAEALAAAGAGGDGTTLAAVDTYASTQTVTGTFSGFFGRALMPWVFDYTTSLWPPRPACYIAHAIGPDTPAPALVGYDLHTKVYIP